jgi:oligopeptidase B
VSLPEPPPVAKRVPERQERFGIVWDDDYAWLRDPGYPEVKDPEILAHLEAENAHFRAFMAPHQDLVDRLHAELKGRIKEDDRSVPAREGGYEYEWRFAAGAQYRTWLRRPLGDMAAEPAVILDENELAASTPTSGWAGWRRARTGRCSPTPPTRTAPSASGCA